MPSLRRAYSSPSVRSSPYPNSSSSPRIGARTRRRSSGTETSSRKVLADIEWWRVLDGQRAVDPDQELLLEENDRDHFTATTDFDDLDVVRPSTPVRYLTENYPSPPSPQTPTSPAVHLDALYVIPHTPTRRHNISQSSSLESSPEGAVTPVEQLRLGIEDLDLHAGLFPASPILAPTKLPAPFLSVRVHSFADSILYNPNEGPPSTGDYADFTVSPFSSHHPDLFN